MEDIPEDDESGAETPSDVPLYTALTSATTYSPRKTIRSALSPYRQGEHEILRTSKVKFAVHELGETVSLKRCSSVLR